MDEVFMKEKPVFPLIVSLGLPMVISMLVNSLYNIVDSYFVARISEDAMTALSLVFPVQNFINAVAIGFGVGINAVISYHLGAGDRHLANVAATHGVLFSVVHGVILMFGCIAIMPTFLGMFTQIGNVIDLGIRYSRIVFSFAVITMLNLSYEKLFQSVGRMNVTMLGLLAGCLTNILLDPIMIFGLGAIPAMGIEGAAWATVIGQVLTLVIYFVVDHVRPLPIRVNRADMPLLKDIDIKLYAIGIPAVLNLALPSLLVSCLNGILTAYSQIYVVILGGYYKLQSFLYLPANGIIQGMRPVIGYNFGAKEYDRVKQIYRVTLCMTSVIMALGTVICLVAAKQLIGLFTDNPETISAGQTALRIISAGFIISAISVTSSGALEGLGKGVQSLSISLCRYVIIMIPAAFLFCQLWGPMGLWNAFWFTEMLTAVIAFIIYRRSVRIPEK